MYSTKKTRYCDDELNNEYSPLSEIVDRYEDDGVEDSEENGGADESKDKDGKNELLKK